MKLVVIANAAGGVGKTSIALACSVAATEYGKKTLLIDADPKAGVTFSCGVENPRVTIKEFLSDEFSLDASMVKTSERFSLLPASSRLANLEFEKLLASGKVKEKLQDFDLVVVDTQSAFSGVTNYFTALADLLVIPSTSDILSVRGAVHTKEFAAQSGYEGIPLLIFNKSSVEVDAEIKRQLQGDFEILEPAIRFDALVPQSQMTGKSFLTTANQSEVSADVREITYSMLEKVGLI